jgi:hypothetical protein
MGRHRQTTSRSSGKSARRHPNAKVLYEVSSSYMEGHCCPLARRGYSRDGKKDTLQIVYGLLCAPNGCPVALEVFDGKHRRSDDPGTPVDEGIDEADGIGPGRRIVEQFWRHKSLGPVGPGDVRHGRDSNVCCAGSEAVLNKISHGLLEFCTYSVR